MEILENIFSTDNDIVEQLKGYAKKPNYEKIFFEHLGPELKKIFNNKKDKVFTNHFLEASQYEYGFLGTEIDLQKAFSLYKNYADGNDYFCMYKMHVIYLCEYEKFNVPLDRTLEKIYILKCLAYLPNYIYDWNVKLFDCIDVAYEIAEILDLEDSDLEKHPLFLDLLYYKREKYNLSENDVNLMKGVFSCYFYKEGTDSHLIAFSMLNSLIKSNEKDYAYYHAKNKAIFFNTYLKLEDAVSDEEAETFYKEVEEQKLYQFYGDYGNYLIDKKNNANPKIIEILTDASKNGNLFCGFRAYQCLLDYNDYEEIMSNYDKAEILLEYLLNEIVFENMTFVQFIILVGFFVKFSNFADKIISKYLIYVKEINNYATSILERKEKEKEEVSEEEYFLYIIKGYLYYFGFQGIEEQNFQKALDFLEKGTKLTKKIFIQKNNAFTKYNIKLLMHSKKLISDDELNTDKKNLIEFFYKNMKLKYEIVDCYIIGEDYFKGIVKKEDEFNALIIYKSAVKIFTKGIVDCMIKDKIKKFLKEHDHKIENKLKDEICCICYDKKISKIFIPCKHNFCEACAAKLEKDSKCPVYKTEILTIV